mgnify:CR=1 FL=1
MTVTPRQAAFVGEYLIDLNASAAAVRAGYSQRRAQEIGYQLLHKPTVAEAIQKALAERSERVKLDADWVVCRLREEAEFTGEGSSPSARVKALELLGKHLGLFPLRGNLSLSLDGQLDVNHETLLEGRRVARRLILEEIRDESAALPGDEE